MEVGAGSPYPLGVRLTADGINVAAATEVADAVELCLFDEAGTETRVELPERTANVFHGSVDGIRAGQRYGLRVHGPWHPDAGLRCNPAKLLLDPYATAISGGFASGQELFSHRFDAPDQQDDSDSAANMPRCIVTDDAFDWEDDHPLATALSETIVYETHVKGISMRHPDVPEDVRGTYAGLGHDAILEHLTGLGVTAVELLPVHQFVQDNHLVDKGLRNYWGYNSIGFFAPHNEYSASGDTGGQVTEFKSMVKALHRAGLEVILDVVYNHTAEGNDAGPTLSLKGLDNPAYYRLVPNAGRHYYDTTGTGNSLNVGHPVALQLIMDSLRYWVRDMHVDGFRFDLATTLTRQYGDLDIHSAFLDLVHQDETLAGVKMIAEPWDTAGYQVGGFPARWSEWNGKYRDDIRDFWRGEDAMIGAFGQRITGSADIYESNRRTPTASVNFITAHDGFTLADLTSYNDKHNDDNGEDNNDGESDNRSWNGGEEGDTNDEAVLRIRDRQRRNYIATLMVSAGIPMLLGGDELGRTQRGNNNAYCQDNEISWFDWDNLDEDLLDFTRRAIALRNDNAAFRPREYLRGPGGEVTQMVLYRADGAEMGHGDWQDTSSKTLAIAIDGRRIPDEEGDTSDDRFLVLVNAYHEPVDFTLPSRRPSWRLVLSTADELTDLDVSDSGILQVPDRSLLVLHR